MLFRTIWKDCFDNKWKRIEDARITSWRSYWHNGSHCTMIMPWEEDYEIRYAWWRRNSEKNVDSFIKERRNMWNKWKKTNDR